MATATPARPIKGRVTEWTVLLTAVGYLLVVGTFGGWFPYPNITESGVDLLGHAIAAVNALATVCLVAGWYWIRNGEVDKHRMAMGSAFTLILVFLVLYLPKVGGGGQKAIADSAPALVSYSYFAMLAIHILLSGLAIPVVVYALLLGLSHTPGELRETRHAQVGRIAAASWILSLVLGVVTYVILNHTYGNTFEPALVALF
jgi:putative membrane protein